MRNASPALSSFLDSKQPYIGADLYVITLTNGVQLFLTSLDRDVTYTGLVMTNPDYGTNTYSSLGQTATGQPVISRSKASWAVSLTPSKVDITISATPNITINSVPLLQTIALGYWSNAQVWIRRAFLLPSDMPANWNSPYPSNLGGAGDGTLIWFSGYVGEVSDLGPLSATLEARDLLWLLNRPLPKNLWSPGCYHILFDAGCTLSKAAWTKVGLCASGSTKIAVNIPETLDQNPPSAPNWGSNPWSGLLFSNYTLPTTSYYVIATYLTAYGETLASSDGDQSDGSWAVGCPPNNYANVASPPTVTGVLYWNIYVGTEVGEEQFQETIAIGTQWSFPNQQGGPLLTGVRPSLFATNGYWSLGVLTIIYNSGAYAGQTFTSFIETSSWNGSSTTCTLRVPLPQIPLSTDSYLIVPGCDKRKTTCGAIPSIGGGTPPWGGPGNPNGGGKFGNLLNYDGENFIPTPEAGA